LKPSIDRNFPTRLSFDTSSKIKMRNTPGANLRHAGAGYTKLPSKVRAADAGVLEVFGKGV